MIEFTLTGSTETGLTVTGARIGPTVTGSNPTGATVAGALIGAAFDWPVWAVTDESVEGDCGLETIEIVPVSAIRRALTIGAGDD
jgi:hypothetical protein